MTVDKFQCSLAVVIGIDDYRNGVPSLKTPVNDAQTLAAILKDSHGYDVKLLLNEDANCTALKDLLETQLPQRLTKDDRLLFYFAGHGIALNGDDGPEGYLIPSGASLGDISTYVSMTTVNQALLKLPCRHFLGILDCCFAGAFRWSSTRKLVPIELGTIHKERFDRFIRDPAWQVITSAASDQFALDAFELKSTQRDAQGDHSPFAAALIEALKGKADAYPPAEPGKEAGDGVITATELYLYLRDRVEPDTETRAMRQTPGIFPLTKHDKGEFIFLSPGHPLNLPPAPPLDESSNPYRGLESFEEAHKDLFFGRQALTHTLAEFVASHALTVVLGASGSGKSSLVKAGLIPKLQQVDDWAFLSPFRPGESPFKALNQVLQVANLPEIAPADEATSSGLLTPAQGLSLWFQEHPHTHLLVVVDQLEELITLCRDQQERKNFLEVLAEAIATHPTQLHLVLTLRSDFEPQFRNTALEPHWQGARFVVPAMTRDELRQAIEAPASARVMYFNPHELVDQLIDEVANMPGALPLLSFALRELYLKYLHRQENAKLQGETIDRSITQTDYDELGGVTRSLTQRANQEYQKLVQEEPAYSQTVCHVMLRMVAVGGELARRRVYFSELEYLEPENTRVKTVIKRFETVRLLTTDKDPKDQSYVEPAHDELVKGWDKLLIWKKEEEESLFLQRRLTPAAEEWRSKQQNRFLWNADPRLDLLKQVLNSENNWFNQVEVDFVRRSLSKKFQNIVIRWIIAGSVIAGSFIFSAAIWIQWRNSELNQANSIGRFSLSLFKEHKELEAFVEAIRAGKILQKQGVTDPEVISALQEALYEGSEHNRLEGHLSKVINVSFSADGKTLASGSDNYTSKLWNLETGQEIRTPKLNFRGSYLIYNISFSPDRKTLALGEQKNIKLWNLGTGKEIGSLEGHKREVRSVSFSPDGKILASGSGDRTIKLWSLEPRQEIRTLKGHTRSVISLSFSPDGKTLASGSDDKTIKIWNVETGKEIHTLSGHDNSVNSLSFSPDGKTLVSGSDDKTIRTWNVETGKEIHILNGHIRPVLSVNISPDGKTLASGSGDKTIKLWNLKTGKEIRTLYGHDHWVNSVSFSPDGKTLASGSTDSTVRIWNLEAANTLRGHNDSINDVSFSPDSRTLISVSGNYDGTIKFWDLKTKKEIRSIKRQDSYDQISDIRISSDFKTMALAEMNAKGIKLWDLETKVKIHTLQGHENIINCLSFSPNGKILASGSSDKTIKLWNVQTGSEIRTLRGHDDKIYRISFSPDGKTLASGSYDGTIILWDLATGKVIRTLRGHENTVGSLSFSPDGKTLASSSWGDFTIVLWDLATGKSTRTLRGHENTVGSLSFSPDGKTLASGSSDKTIKLWNVQTGAEVHTLRGHDSYIESVNFSPDGKILASGGSDKTIKLWDMDLGSLTRQSCNWIQGYLENNPKVRDSDRHLCNGI